MVAFLGFLLAAVLRYAPAFIEGLFLLVAIRTAFTSPQLGAKWFRALEVSFGRLARKRRLSVLLAGLVVLAARVALLPLLPVPEPLIQDEFSYLLAADTFASGRLANPPHPMWVHFESMGVNQQPTYTSKFPPAQGLVLAAGKVLAGSAWLGVCLSVAVMCSAICWMLEAWLPPGWALLGGILAAMRLGIFGYWMNSYWGGAVAATGGALVLGAMPRIMRRQRIGDALLLALGVAILANSRPYEGFVLCAPVAVALLLWMFGKKGPAASITIQRVALPIFLALAFAAAAMGFYNWRVTGSPLRVPHRLHGETYTIAPLFLWQSLRPAPNYHHQAMHDFYVGWEGGLFLKSNSLWGAVRNALEKGRDFWLFFLGPLFTLPLVMLPRVLRDRRTRFLLITLVIFSVGLFLDAWFYPHYAAPMTALLYAIVLQAMRHLRFCKWGERRPGQLLAPSIPLVCFAMVVLLICAQPFNHFLSEFPLNWFHTGPGNVDRARILADLERRDGRHLVIVRYGPGHNVLGEWIYNRADLDRAKVLWARDMGPSGNEEMIRYFTDRRVWVVEPDRSPPRLSPYAGFPVP